jgi:tetratricopeptide (TPR) repeat protein
VARADRRRAARARPATPASRYQSARVGTDDLFFQRLRRQAKWAFVFLALVFGVGFVAFGVGSDVPGGIADVLGGGGAGSSGPSASEAREKLEENPRDPQALRDLATALQQEGKPTEAIAPLEQYTRLRPKDEEALRELGSLYLAQATDVGTEAQLAQLQVQSLDPGSLFRPSEGSDLGRALGSGQIVSAATAEANERFTRLLTELQGIYGKATTTYQNIAELAPDDPSVQIQLADAAVNAGDTAAALTAYKRFIALAPDDPSAPLVRQEIRRLELALEPAPQAEQDGN